jgi:hypothetical protein
MIACPPGGFRGDLGVGAQQAWVTRGAFERNGSAKAGASNFDSTELDGSRWAELPGHSPCVVISRQRPPSCPSHRVYRALTIRKWCSAPDHMPLFTFMLMVVIIVTVASCYYPSTLNMHLLPTAAVATTVPHNHSSVAEWPSVLCCSKKSPPNLVVCTPNMLELHNYRTDVTRSSTRKIIQRFPSTADFSGVATVA